jgi:Tetratricopeptide repeat
MLAHQLSAQPPSTKSTSETIRIVNGDYLMGGLPPKSPLSFTGRLLQSANTSSRPRRRSKRRSGRDCTQIGPQSQEPIFSVWSSVESSLGQQSSTPVQLCVNRSLPDPSPPHMKVAGNSDDLFCTPDLSGVTFESPPSVKDQSFGSLYTKAPASSGPIRSRYNSWDSSNGNDVANKSCLPSFRRQKIVSADVASVGNASDTLVMTGDFGGPISGRDLHEKAKAVLNAGNYDEAIIMFEAIQKAQEDRFGVFHPSVGAAIHNVAVVRLRMGQAHVAEELFEQAVSIRRKVLGNKHLDLAVSNTNMDRCW